MNIENGPQLDVDEISNLPSSPSMDGIDIGLTGDGMVRVRFSLGEKKLIMLWQPEMASMYADLISRAAGNCEKIQEELRDREES